MKEYFEKHVPKIEEELANCIPASVDNIWLMENLENKTMQSRIPDSELKLQFDEMSWSEAIAKPMLELLDSGGKRIRPLLTVLIHDMFGGKNNDIYKIATIPEIVHNATLMIDDIEDNSTIRRGNECAYLKYGVNIAVNNGNFFYLWPLRYISTTESTKEQKNRLYSVFCDKLMKLHIGQAMDISWSNNASYDDISKDKYMQMTAYKTGALLSISMQFGAIMAEIDNEEILNRIDDLAIKMGIAYQLKDDVLNLSASGEWGKEMGEDITEGKITLLVIETLKKANKDDKSRLLQILKLETNKKEELIEAIDIMNKYDSLKEAEILAFNLIVDCKNDLLEFFPKNEYRNIMDEILEYLIERKK